MLLIKYQNIGYIEGKVFILVLLCLILLVSLVFKILKRLHLLDLSNFEIGNNRKGKILMDT